MSTDRQLASGYRLLGWVVAVPGRCRSPRFAGRASNVLRTKEYSPWCWEVWESSDAVNALRPRPYGGWSLSD